jgi:hypothetical protein
MNFITLKKGESYAQVMCNTHGGFAREFDGRLLRKD